SKPRPVSDTCSARLCVELTAGRRTGDSQRYALCRVGGQRAGDNNRLPAVRRISDEFGAGLHGQTSRMTNAVCRAYQGNHDNAEDKMAALTRTQKSCVMKSRTSPPL